MPPRKVALAGRVGKPVRQVQHVIGQPHQLIEIPLVAGVFVGRRKVSQFPAAAAEQLIGDSLVGVAVSNGPHHRPDGLVGAARLNLLGESGQGSRIRQEARTDALEVRQGFVLRPEGGVRSDEQQTAGQKTKRERVHKSVLE